MNTLNYSFRPRLRGNEKNLRYLSKCVNRFPHLAVLKPVVDEMNLSRTTINVAQSIATLTKQIKQ